MSLRGQGEQMSSRGSIVASFLSALPYSFGWCDAVLERGRVGARRPRAWRFAWRVTSARLQNPSRRSTG